MHHYRIGVFGDAPKDFFIWLSRYGIVHSVSSLDTPKSNPLDLLVMYNTLDISGVNLDAPAIRLPGNLSLANFDRCSLKQSLATAYFLRKGFLRYANIIPIYLVGDAISLIPLIYSSIGDELVTEVNKLKSVYLPHEDKTALKLAYNSAIIKGLEDEGVNIPKGVTTPEIMNTKLHLPSEIRNFDSDNVGVTPIAMYEVADIGVTLATGVLTKGEMTVEEAKVPVIGLTTFDPSQIKNRYHSALYKMSGPYGEVSSSFLMTILLDRSDKLLGRGDNDDGGDNGGGNNDNPPKPPIGGRDKEENKEESKEPVVVEEKRLSKSLEELFKTLKRDE